MGIVIILFGLFIVAASFYLVLRPNEFSDLMLRHAGDRWLHVLAAAARIGLGIVLILHAPATRFPLTLTVLGWIALVAGIILVLMPPSVFHKLIRWVFDRLGSYARAAGVLAFLFGAFLIYAVV